MKEQKKFRVSQNCIHKGLKKLCVSYKKTFKNPKVNEEERILFKKKIALYISEGKNLSYIDESSFTVDIAKNVRICKSWR